MLRKFRVVFASLVLAGIAIPAGAQQAASPAPPDPVVQLFLAKGYLTKEEAASISQAPTRSEADNRMLKIFLSKGLISQQEFDSAAAATLAPAADGAATGAHLALASAGATPSAALSANAAANDAGASGESADVKVISAIAPPRPLPIGIPRDPKGIIPDIKLGSGAMLNFYGFIKATAIYDTTNSGGAVNGSNDFPLPLLMGDTGPDAGSQFRVKARSTRLGANFFWPLNGPDITLTGKIEFDFEGDYTTVNNRNVSSARSSQASIRHAWMRMDKKLGDVPWFAEFGQDWTILGSSIVPDYIESTNNGVAFGSIYERVPQVRTGLQFHAGDLKIEPEVAVVLAAFADSNLNSSSTASILGSLGQIPTGQQEQNREGAILGPASGEPGVQGRLVFDFPLDKSWKGVENAEIIFSGGHAEARDIVPLANIPTTPVAGLTTPNPDCTAPTVAVPCSVRSYYPHGLALNIPQNIFTAGFQLPTPWVTLWTNYFRGGDMRFYFAGVLNSAFADTSAGAPITIPGTTILCTAGTTGCSTGGTATLTQNVLTLSGDTVTFVNPGKGCTGATPTDCVAQVAPYRPIRGQGGFVQLGFPLSRIFGANPEGINSGWRLFLAYGTDSAFNRDVVRSGGNNLRRTDYVPVSLRYKINRWAEVVNETTWYDTRTGTKAGGVPVLVDVAGVPARINHDWRNEFGTIFTF